MSTYRILVIDDNPTALETVRDRLEQLHEVNGVEFVAEEFSSFQEARSALARTRYDFAVIDLREDGEGAPQNDAGLDLFRNIQSTDFLPVIFHTAYEEDVGDEVRALPFVWIVSKTEPLELDRAIMELVESQIMETVDRLYSSITDEIRKYLWDQGSLDRIHADSTVLKQILFRRVAAKLDCAIGSLSAEVGSHRMYLLPPVTDELSCGDLLRLGDQSWAVVTTPACDLAVRSSGTPKADHVRLGTALPELQVPMGKAKREIFLRDAHTARVPRYFYLPRFADVPSLLVDLQQVTSVPYTDLLASLSEGSAVRVATLDAPYAEELLVRSSHFAGRVGSPDLSAPAYDLEGEAGGNRDCPGFG